ncbi:hypothetical protein [Brevundimonas sp.]|uniref:hypothetical protein n=1 Tax=Brevundimonas sp. TaxID=1871086 RepID=UPI00272EF2A7|nr:hypothetical protein [Brevundimonas sp.]MDP1912655.1 hypothetical protein [Brevundimonas sp.]
MITAHRLIGVATLGAIAFATAACTPADNDADVVETDKTTIIERQVPSAPVVVEREVAVPGPPVVIESDRRGDSTTVRAGRDGIEVETTKR